LFVNCTN